MLTVFVLGIFGSYLMTGYNANLAWFDMPVPMRLLASPRVAREGDALRLRSYDHADHSASDVR